MPRQSQFEAAVDVPDDKFTGLCCRVLLDGLQNGGVRSVRLTQQINAVRETFDPKNLRMCCTLLGDFNQTRIPGCFDDGHVKCKITLEKFHQTAPVQYIVSVWSGL